MICVCIRIYVYICNAESRWCSIRHRVLWRCSMIQGTAHHPMNAVPTQARPGHPMYQFSYQVGSRHTRQKNTASFSSVLESWYGWWESPVNTRANWMEQTDWSKGHHSFSIFSWVQWICRPSCSLGEAFFSLLLLSKESRETSISSFSLTKYPSYCIY